jgi:hypothetical protein
MALAKVYANQGRSIIIVSCTNSADYQDMYTVIISDVRLVQ